MKSRRTVFVAKTPALVRRNKRLQSHTKSNMQLCFCISILLLNARDEYDEHDFFHLHALLLMFRVTCRTKASRAQFRQRSTLSALKPTEDKTWGTQIGGRLTQPHTTLSFRKEPAGKENRNLHGTTEKTHHMRSASGLWWPQHPTKLQHSSFL